MNGIILIIVLLFLASFVQYFREQIMKLTRDNIKYYVKLISKIQRTQTDRDFKFYFYDYEIMLYEDESKHNFCIQERDLEIEFNDNDFDFILKYVQQEVIQYRFYLQLLTY